MPQQDDVFAKLEWKKGRLLLEDLVFEIDDDGSGRREPGEPGFTFLKPKRMIDEYTRLWRLRDDFAPRNILELGIHAGGSIVFWFEVFQPDRLVAIDIASTGDNSLLRQYVASRGLQDRIKTHWETSQADSQRLEQIVAADFSGRLDMVIDDASHVYELTKTSFETLFPLLRPGGLYIIEDWSWACWSNLPADFNPSMTKLPAGMGLSDLSLPRLICEIVVSAGKMEGFLSQSDGFLSLKPIIADVHVYPDFVVIERGEADPAAIGQFKLERHVPTWRRATPRGLLRRVLRKITS